MTKNIKTSRVSKSDYINYLKKSEEFLSSAQDSLIKEKWNAAGLNAIHAGISSAYPYRTQRTSRNFRKNA